MPYKINWDKSGVVIQFTGHVNDKILIAVADGLQGDPRFDELRYIIADYSCCSKFSVTQEELEYVIATSAASALSNNKIRVAIVSAAPEIVTAADRFITSPLTVFPFRTFQILEAAYKWLGIQNRSY